MITFFESMQILTVSVGVVCAAMPFGLFLHFIKSSRPIGKAVAFMLLGESIGIGLTVCFSITAEGVLDIITPLASMIMRWVMFGAAIISSTHLAYRTWMIETGNEE